MVIYVYMSLTMYKILTIGVIFIISNKSNIRGVFNK
jgi:hypothetical protein